MEIMKIKITKIKPDIKVMAIGGNMINSGTKKKHFRIW